MTRLQEAIAYIVVVLLAGLLAGLLAWFAWGRVYDHVYDTGVMAERAIWQKKERQLLLDQAELRRIHTAEMRRIAGLHQQVNEKVSQDHEQAITDLRRDRAADIRAAEQRGGLRISAGVCRGEAGAGTEAARPGGRDEETTGTVRLPQQVEADLWALAGDADEVTEQLRACQSWITRQGFYGQAPTN